MFLLAVNNHNKDGYVRRWIHEFQDLSPGWELQIVSNGETEQFGKFQAIRCENPDVTLGYRCALQATEVRRDLGLVVSVHAKTWLTDIRLLDRITRTVRPGDDGFFLDRTRLWDAVGGGEFLFLFGLRPFAWLAFCDRMSSTDPGLWNEVAAARALDGFQIRRISAQHALNSGRDCYVARDIDGTGVDLFGCEPGRHGFKEIGGHEYDIGPDGRAVLVPKYRDTQRS
jgi:hypothetical protein